MKFIVKLTEVHGFWIKSGELSVRWVRDSVSRMVVGLRSFLLLRTVVSSLFWWISVKIYELERDSDDFQI